MSNRLQKLYSSLGEQERILQFGRATGNPLQEAFDSKRITHAGVGGKPLQESEKLQTWLELLQNTSRSNRQRSVYIHIPFCQTKCLYCMFYQNPCLEDSMNAYVDLLIKEIQSTAQESYIQNTPVNAVFFGGGTPSSLSANNAAKLLKTIQSCLPLSNDCEVTMEGRVSDLVPEKLESWFAHGVNRISIGVQSFNSKVRQQIGRIDPQETIVDNLTRVATYNQASLVIDLMFGLPDQTMSVWEQDLQMLHNLPIDGADLYQLNLYENSALKQAIDNGHLNPAATTAQQAQMFAFAHDWLSKRAYKRLSHCHWANSNRERSLYNTLTKDGAETIPFGCGAGGNIGDYSLMLHRNINAYQQLVGMGIKPIMVMQQQSDERQLNSYITSQLEQGYLDFDQLISNYSTDYLELKWLLELFVERGLMQYNGVIYSMTLAGQFWVVNITQTMLEACKFLKQGEHSLTHHKISAQG